MKKNYSLLLFLLFFICVSPVYAEEYSCFYNYSIPSTSGTKDGTVEMIINTEEKTINLEGGWGNDDPGLIDPNIDSVWTESHLIDNYLLTTVENSKVYVCPNYIYACDSTKEYTSSSGNASSSKLYLPLINMNLLDKIAELEAVTGLVPLPLMFEGKDTSSNTRYWINVNSRPIDKVCVGAAVDTNKSEKKSIDIGLPCDKYNELWEKVSQLYCNGENCSTLQYKQAKDNIKNYCNIKLKYSIYSDPCVKSCLKLSKAINTLEGKTSNDYKCGLSQRLLAWVANIVRWIKYIIPVAVIVLGILDFIKAIGADKDDEMKKAQGRFVKRLIAAALIFIIPFIIEFVLDKMGFTEYISGCGIIDL